MFCKEVKWMSAYEDDYSFELYEMMGIREAIEEQNKILLMTPAERQEYRRQKEERKRLYWERRLQVHVVATSPKKDGYQKDGGGGYLGGLG